MATEDRWLNAGDCPNIDCRLSVDIKKCFLIIKSPHVFGDSYFRISSKMGNNWTMFSSLYTKPLVINEGGLINVKPIPIIGKGKGIAKLEDVLKSPK